MPGATRDSERTRATVLAAAAKAIGERGPNVSLDVIARRAGVSKGGLLHHFASREDLITALVREQRERFRESVEQELNDEPEGRAGRYTRAVVRAVFAEVSKDAQRARAQWTLMGMVTTVTTATSLLQQDDEARRARVAQDGIDPLRAEAILNAAFGTSACMLWNQEPSQNHDQLCEALQALTSQTGPILTGS